MKNLKKQKNKITKKMTFTDVLQKHPESAEVFMEEGLYCVGCPMSSAETIEQGIKAHGLNVEKIMKKLNKKLKRK